ESLSLKYMDDYITLLVDSLYVQRSYSRESILREIENSRLRSEMFKTWLLHQFGKSAAHLLYTEYNELSPFEALLRYRLILREALRMPQTYRKVVKEVCSFY